MADHPETALVLLGHGNEGLTSITKTLRVPKGTIVVVKAHSGDVTQYQDIKQQEAHLFNKENIDYLLDPINNIDKITDFFGSVAIYTEGQVCPNIQNSGLLYWENEEVISVAASGLIRLPLDEFTDKFIDKVKNTYYTFPKTWSISDYFNQKYLEDGMNMKNIFGLSVKNTPSMGSFVSTADNFLFNGKAYAGKTFAERLKDLETEYTTDIKRVLDGVKQPVVLYLFACRFIDGHEMYVPEKVRLGTNNTNSIIITNPTAKPRPNTSQSNNSHLKQYLKAVGKTTTTKIARNKERKNTGHINEAPTKTMVTPSAIERAVLGFKNRNINIATKRARVTKIAPEIQQQISESKLQRHLSSLSLEKKWETRKNKV